MISGVSLYPLLRIPDARGVVGHLLRADAAHFGGMGEVYWSLCYAGQVKAWKRHRKIMTSMAIVSGNAKVVVYDNRVGSKTYCSVKEFFIGESNYQLIQIAPMLWNGFMAVGGKDALMVSVATEPFSEEEIERMPPDRRSVAYSW